MRPFPSFPPDPLAGAICALHPQSAATALCARCGSFACPACSDFGRDGQTYCDRCAQSSLDLADRGTRFVANLIDGLILGGAIIVGVIPGALASAADAREVAGLLMVFGILFAFGGYAVLQLAMQARFGQSVGKKLFGIRVLRTDGSPVSLSRLVFLRNGLPQVLNAVVGIFNVIDAVFIFGERRLCLHDMFADTIVVRVLR